MRKYRMTIYRSTRREEVKTKMATAKKAKCAMKGGNCAPAAKATPAKKASKSGKGK